MYHVEIEAGDWLIVYISNRVELAVAHFEHLRQQTTSGLRMRSGEAILLVT